MLNEHYSTRYQHCNYINCVLLKQGKKMKRYVILLSSIVLTIGAPHSARCNEQAHANPSEDISSSNPADKQRTLLEKAYEESEKSAIHGPATITLRDQAVVNLPEGKEFIPADSANLVMKAIGNEDNTNRVGLIIDEGGFIKSFTLMDILWINSGFIKDDEASKLDAQPLLEHLRKDQEQANKQRKKDGLEELYLDSWAEKPTYDAQSHRFYWSILLHGANDSYQEGTLNYRIRLLGREGFFSMDMIGPTSAFEALKPIANELADNTHYNEGKRYTDFNEKTDHIAAYGLLGLLGIFTAKKLGLLAILGIWAIKLTKPLLIAAGAAVIACKRFLKRKKD